MSPVWGFARCCCLAAFSMSYTLLFRELFAQRLPHYTVSSPAWDRHRWNGVLGRRWETVLVSGRSSVGVPSKAVLLTQPSGKGSELLFEWHFSGRQYVPGNHKAVFSALPSQNSNKCTRSTMKYVLSYKKEHFVLISVVPQRKVMVFLKSI